MKIRSLQTTLFFGLLSFFTACNTDTSTKQNVATQATDSAKTEAIPPKPATRTFDRTADYVSRVIAGMAVTEDDKYAAICESAAWKRYAASMDSSWHKVEQQRLHKMRAWAETELADASTTEVFYPFSGPDFIHAYTFFPAADHYYLFGLEPIGDLPDLSKQTTNQAVQYCEAVRDALRDVFQRSYFLTKRMSNAVPHISGMLPLMCVFLVRTGNVVTNVQPLVLLENGQTMNWKGPTDTNPQNKLRLIRIDFLDATTQTPKSIYYYSGDLSDAGIKAKPAVAAYLNQLPDNCTGYLKSASYLMHYDSFSTIRNSMLEKCKTLLQDDTGIAYKYLNPAAWNIQLYGVYTPPIEEFKGRFQTQLDKDYQDTTRVKRLPFEIGYHWGTHKDNLLLARKKQ